MHHSKEPIDPKAYALGVLLEHYSELFDFVYRNRHEDKKEALNRIKTALDILDTAFVDEISFKDQLSVYSAYQRKALALIEKQRKEIETLKSNIK